MKKIKLIILVIMIFLALVAVFPLLPWLKGWYATRAVLTGSMEPSIFKGSLIFNKWTEDKNLQVDDVITYRRPDRKNFFITHRIIKKEKAGFLYFFTTKGDQVPAADPWKINQSLIEGKVIFVVPLLGYLFLFMQSPWGLLFFILLPAFLLIFDEIKIIRREWKKIKREKQLVSNLITGLIIFFFCLKQISPAYAYFQTSGVVLGGVDLITASQFTPSDTDSPKSSTGILADYFNRLTFDVPFSANDDASEIKKVELYYSRDLLGGWVKFAEQSFSGNKTVSGNFSFNSPLGEGYYRFLTVATDALDNVEYNNDLYFVPANSWTIAEEVHDAVLVDTAPPITNLSLSQPAAVANDQIYNGGFENGNLDGWVTAGNGTHQVNQAESKTGVYSALLGNGSTDFLSKTVNLTADSVSTLSFWYKLLTDDSGGGGFFDALIKTTDGEIKIAHDGWDDPSLLETDLDWKNVTYQLKDLQGQTVDFQFKVTQPIEGYQTRAYLDDVRLTTATNSAITLTQINFASHDVSGSGTAKTEYKIDEGEWQENTGPINPPKGTHQIDYFSTDLAGNLEATKSATISVVTEPQVDFGVVINEFLPDPQGDDYASAPNGEWVELYNNSLSAIDVNGWKLRDDSNHELIITSVKTNGAGTIINSGGKLRIYRKGNAEESGSSFLMNNDGDSVRLYNFDNILVDSFIYTFSLSGKSFKREPDGVGTWKDPEIVQEKTDSNASPSDTILPSFLPEIISEATNSVSLEQEAALSALPSPSSTPEIIPTPPPTSEPTPTPTPTDSPIPTSDPAVLSSPIPTVSPSPSVLPEPPLPPKDINLVPDSKVSDNQETNQDTIN